MSMHKHAVVICEWARNTNKIVQFRTKESTKWIDCDLQPSWNVDFDYRIKPEPSNVKSTLPITDFCAKGDGTADDTDAIKEAVAYALGTDGEVTITPPVGVYKINSVFSIPKKEKSKLRYKSPWSNK